LTANFKKAQQTRFTIKTLRNHFIYESLRQLFVTAYILYNVYVRLYIFVISPAQSVRDQQRSAGPVWETLF